LKEREKERDMLFSWDTETAGLPQDHLPDDHPSQPHLVEVGGILYDDAGQERAVLDLIVRADGWTVPKAAADVHGITTEVAKRYGAPLAVVLPVFYNLLALAEEDIAYNRRFDEKIMRFALTRLGREPTLSVPKRRTDLLEVVTPIVNLPPTARMIAAGFNKPKAPKLVEAYKHFFGQEEADAFAKQAHGAVHDARASARIYFHLRDQGLLPDERGGTTVADEYGAFKQKEAAR